MPKKIKDSYNIQWINRLIGEEKEAIESYKEAIASCKDAKVLDVYTHILQEEIEHVEELERLKEELSETGVKDSKFKDGDIYYIVKVNGERILKTTSASEAWKSAESYMQDDSGYYGSYPDVEVIKETADGVRIKDSKNAPTLKTYLDDWIDAFLDNDDEISDKYRKAFRKIQNDSYLMSKIAKKLREQLRQNNIEDLSNLDNAPEVSELTYKILKQYI